MTDTEGTLRGDLARARLGLVFHLPGLIQPARLGVVPIGHKMTDRLDVIRQSVYPQSH